MLLAESSVVISRVQKVSSQRWRGMVTQIFSASPLPCPTARHGFQGNEVKLEHEHKKSAKNYIQSHRKNNYHYSMLTCDISQCHICILLTFPQDIYYMYDFKAIDDQVEAS